MLIKVRQQTDKEWLAEVIATSATGTTAIDATNNLKQAIDEALLALKKPDEVSKAQVVIIPLEPATSADDALKFFQRMFPRMDIPNLETASGVVADILVEWVARATK